MNVVKSMLIGVKGYLFVVKSAMSVAKEETVMFYQRTGAAIGKKVLI